MKTIDAIATILGVILGAIVVHLVTNIFIPLAGILIG